MCDGLIKGYEARSTGVSAMSVSDMTGIPRATVIRKCKFLVKNDYLRLNNTFFQKYAIKAKQSNVYLNHPNLLFIV